ncbi:MAG: hypothetical protein B7733_20415 [Myxococcales bacterium FL481]|nr:MAG: hypothetical protein B7733_20415 [Myxococcales bacterium FL481]
MTGPGALPRSRRHPAGRACSAARGDCYRGAMATAGLTKEEVEVFARGLHFLATRDPITPREEELVREFLREAGSVLRFEDLDSTSFDPLEAAQILSATYLRRIFVKTGMVLVRSDGDFSPREREALGQIADVFGISNTEYGDIERHARGLSLD